MPAADLPHSTHSQAHWPALDLVKCGSVAGMLLVHAACYFLMWQGGLQLAEGDPAIGWARRGMVIGYSSLILPVTAGCSFFIGLFRDLPVGRLSGAQLLRPLATGLVLIGVGYVTNVLELGWRFLDVWQILQFVGLSLIVMSLLAWRLPRAAIPVAGALALIFAPWLRGQFGNSPAMYRQALFETMLPINSWPFFPWFSLVAFGFTMAWVRDRAPRRFLWLLLGTGAALITWAWARGSLLPPFNPTLLSGYELFNPAPDFVVAVLGVASLSFALAEAIGPRITLPRYGVVNVYSKGILWIYIIHLAVLHRLYVWITRYFDMRAFAADAAKGPNLAAVAAWWLALLLLAYGIGYAAIRLLQEKRVHVRLRRA